MDLDLFDQDDYFHRKEVCHMFTVELETGDLFHLQQINNITVVRDDLVCGGTKSRYVPKILSRDYMKYVYPCTLIGGLQIALILTVNKFNSLDGGNREAHIFTQNTGEMSAFQRFAQNLGAIYHWIDGDQEQVHQAAEEFSLNNPNTYLVPNGIDTSEARHQISLLASGLREKLGQFDIVVSVMGSGSLTRGLQMGHLGKKYYAISVYGQSGYLNEAKVIPYPLPYYERVLPEEEPPFPSARRYDAKAWGTTLRLSQLYPDSRIIMWSVM